MINFALFLHFYQPSTQFPEVLAEINRSSYEPLISIFKDYPRAKVTVNLAGSLLDLWRETGRADIIHWWKETLRSGSLEVVGSAKYHPLLPKLPFSEIQRQVLLQEHSLHDVLDLGTPRGFFPPEMGYSRRVAEAVASRGYSWILLDGSADSGQKSPLTLHPPFTTVKEIAGLNLKALFRDTVFSQRVAFAELTRLDEFMATIRSWKTDQGYFILAMDAETFGWHRPDQLNLLRAIFEAEENGRLGVKLVSLSEICQTFASGGQTEPLTSTWGMAIEEVEKGRIFPRWDNPANEIHRAQWQLFNLAVSAVSSDSDHVRARQALDLGEQSDQFWWAGGDPCWHPLMVEKGAELLKQAVVFAPNAMLSDKEKAEDLVMTIKKLGRAKFGNKPISC